MSAPDDPIGTVRAGDDALAVRGYDNDSGEPLWYIFNIGASLPDPSGLGRWPIVYQPAPQANAVG